MTSPAGGPDDLPAPPEDAVEQLFGARRRLAVVYAELLAGPGVERGLIGPREVPRIWDRHVLNSALVASLVPEGVRVVDVGSGAGLPGIPLALARPDVEVVLVEPLLRRSEFLGEVVESLGLSEQVRVVRGRAEEPLVRQVAGDAPVVTARAVAPVDRLVKWCVPLLRPEGTLLALKGSSAADEVVAHSAALARAGLESVEVHELSRAAVSPTWVIAARRSARARARRRGSR